MIPEASAFKLVSSAPENERADDVQTKTTESSSSVEKSSTPKLHFRLVLADFLLEMY